MLALILAAASALAQPADAKSETRKDVRCFIVLSAVAGGDAEAADAAMIGAQYFLGRLDGRVPGLDLEAAIAIEAPLLSESDFPGLLQSCGKTMEQRGRQVIEIGKRLEARGI